MLGLIGYIILGLFITFIEVSRKRYFKTYDILSFIHLIFFICYVLTPIFLIYDVKIFSDNKLVYGIIYFGKWFTPYLIIIAYSFFLWGYFNKVTNKLNLGYFRLRIGKNIIIIFLILLISILTLSIFFYSYGYGGVINAIIKSDLIRDGKISPHKFAFFKRFFSLIQLALYFTYYKSFLESKKNQLNKFVFYNLFLISIILFILIVLLLNSRTFLLFSILGLFFITSFVKNKFYLKKISILFLLSLIFIVVGDPLFQSIPDLIDFGTSKFWERFSIESMKQINTFAPKFISNFSHPIVSLEVSISKTFFEVEPRYFKDFIIAFISLVPEKLLNLEIPESIAYLNTYLNYRKFESIVPPGLLGLFWYSLGPIGLFLGMFFYGVVARGLHNVFTDSFKVNKIFSIFYFFSALHLGLFVMSGEPRSTLKGFFMIYFIIFLFITLLSTKYHENKS